MRWIALCGLCASLPAAAQRPVVVFEEPFESLAPAVWYEATNGRHQTGAPQEWSIGTLDGRTVLRMESSLTGPERRGFLTHATFPMRRTRITIDFSPLAGEGAPVEAWTLFPFGDALIALGARASGKERDIQLETTNFAYPSPLAEPWEYGAWYRYTLEASATRARFSLARGGQTLWTRDFPWLLCEIAPEWGLGVLQYLSAGGGVLEGAVDHIRVEVGCGADLNDDGELNLRDFHEFINAWADRSCRADLSDDRFLDAADVERFLASFAAGCL
jgi:hypothetical protein